MANGQIVNPKRNHYGKKIYCTSGNGQRLGKWKEESSKSPKFPAYRSICCLPTFTGLIDVGRMERKNHM